MNNNELIDTCYNNNNILYVAKNKHITISDLSIYDGIKLAPKSGVYSKMDETRVFNKDAFETIELKINPSDSSSSAASIADILSDDSWNISDYLSSDNDMDLTGNNAAESSDLANN